MEWIGTGFVLTIGGMRLRVRIALEDTPDPLRRDAAAHDEPRAEREPVARPRRAHDGASSLN